ncbi:transposase [Roseomonas sp. M0104]|uniref:Transposase n=1 Tax=Teichococcus coralli TaxID=2545983 RepID=A0A845BIT3_9PROT|nr:transposase [Pseudoroseomonas coralli]
MLEPMIPQAKRTGQHRSWPPRLVLGALFFVLCSGCPWRMLPERFPPRQSVYGWFLLWRDRGLFEALFHLAFEPWDQLGQVPSSGENPPFRERIPPLSGLGTLWAG